MKAFDKIVKFSQEADLGNMQKIGGTIAMALSAMAFTGSILMNKGIPGEQKKFLVSQELSDGAINVGLFWTITGQANAMAQKRVKNGSILPKSIKEEVESIKKRCGEDISIDDLSKQLSHENLEKFRDFKAGFPAFVSLCGSLVAVNIVTPIVRNIIASNFQKKYTGNIGKEKTITAQKPAGVVTPLPIAPYSVGNKGQIKI